MSELIPVNIVIADRSYRLPTRLVEPVNLVLSSSLLTIRTLATQLFDQGVDLTLLESAFLLAIARRCSRHPDLPPPPPIRSLAYFLPVLEEIRQAPPDPEYLRHLRLRLELMVQFPTDSGAR